MGDVPKNARSHFPLQSRHVFAMDIFRPLYLWVCIECAGMRKTLHLGTCPEGLNASEVGRPAVC